MKSQRTDHVTPRVTTEFRGEVCVIHCGGAKDAELVRALPKELERCRRAGAWEVVIDLDPWLPLAAAGFGALRRAAAAFREAGGELVVAVEEREARAALSEAGLMHAVPPSPVPAGRSEEEAPLEAPDRPHWEHEFVFPATVEELAAARRRIAIFAEVAGLEGSDLFELSVAVAEALANAVVHGSPHRGQDEVRVRFFCYEDEIAVEVMDHGRGLRTSPLSIPAASETSGRGMHFMRALTDAVQFTCGPYGTHVLLVKKRS